MTAANYDECLRRVLAHEGGYSNHPADPGGPTNYGITIYDCRKYWNAKATAADVKAMPISVAKAIYKSKYWKAESCDDLPSGVDDTIFDYGVNSGIGRSGKVLRRVVGLPDYTSAITSEVIQAVSKRDPGAVINAINDERLAFLKQLKTWPVFGPGWERRVREVRAFSLALASNRIVPPAPAPTESKGKAVVRKPDVNKRVGAGAGTSGAATGVAFHDWIWAHPTVSFVIAFAIVGGALFIGHMLANRWQERAQEAPVPNTPVVPETSNVVRL